MKRRNRLIANLILIDDIHLSIVIFQPHFTLECFDHFVLCCGFAVSCVWDFLTFGGLI